MCIEIGLLAVVLALQPVMFVLALVVGMLLGTKALGRLSGGWMDARLEKAREQAEELR